jgi:hypothetical protein
LSDLVDSLPEKALPSVLDEALTLILEDFSDDPDICEGVTRFHSRQPRPDQEFASYLEERSHAADAEYIRLEEADAPSATYNLEYQRYNILFALSRIFYAREVTLSLVDDVVAELGNGAHDTTRFGAKLEQKLRETTK